MADEQKLNNRWTLEIGDPLLRPGLVIKTEGSEGYITKIAKKAMNIVRDINETTER